MVRNQNHLASSANSPLGQTHECPRKNRITCTSIPSASDSKPPWDTNEIILKPWLPWQLHRKASSWLTTEQALEVLQWWNFLWAILQHQHSRFKNVKCDKVTKAVAYPAVLPPGINLHVAAIVGILQQAVVLKEQPGALSQTLALVVVILLDEFLHQLEQTFRVPSIPLDQVLG